MTQTQSACIIIACASNRSVPGHSLRSTYEETEAMMRRGETVLRQSPSSTLSHQITATSIEYYPHETHRIRLDPPYFTLAFSHCAFFVRVALSFLRRQHHLRRKAPRAPSPFSHVPLNILQSTLPQDSLYRRCPGHSLSPALPGSPALKHLILP